MNNSITEFVLTTLLLLAVVTIYAFWGKGWPYVKSYFASDAGKGVLKGIILATGSVTLLAILSTVVGCSGTYLNEASVYAGLDSTKNISPQCEAEGPNDRLTSNLGARVNLYESEDGRFSNNLQYTHHSCAFNIDATGYDAYGFQLDYKIWNKK